MTRKIIWGHFLTAIVLLLILTCPTRAQEPVSAAPDVETQSASLVFNQKRLVTFYGTLDGLTPDERVERTSIVLRKLLSEKDFDINSIRAVDGQSGTDIVASNQRIVTITERDAVSAQGNTRLVANDFILKLKYALVRKEASADPSLLAKGIAFCAIGFFIMVLLTAIVCRISIFANDRLRRLHDTTMQGLRIQKAELISADTLFDIGRGIIKLVQCSSIFVLLTTYILVALSFFPNTRPICDALIESARIPLSSLGDSILHYLPNLFTIVVIALLTYGTMFIARFFFCAVRDGSISFADFDPQWAEPTYKLVRFVLVFFGLVCALPYLPSWDSPAFKQLGLLVGVLISFGSSSAVSNVMAGVVLTYTNAFRVGDRVRLADSVGDVIEKTLFVTRLKTPKGEIVSIPNGPILAGSITNYSVEAETGKLILNKTVTIGYDAPWRKVHEALLSAARKTPDLLAEPEPFVLQRSLDDFYVTYEINAYTDHPHHMLETYSNLNANIQDSFFEAGLEIMSPHFTSLRDGNHPAIPDEYLGENYQAPGFKVTH
jgi:small-conductance mechanosensitive channel